jgi:hypothetical protein
MFRSLFYDHLQGSSFVLSAFTTFRLPASSFVFFVCGRMPSAMHCIALHCIADSIWPHIKKTNDEAGSQKVVNECDNMHGEKVKTLYVYVNIYTFVM